MSGPLLTITGLDVVAGPRWMVRELDLVLEEGTVLALLGGPAAGKSCLLEAIMGVRPQQRGRILLAGRPIEASPAEARVAQGLAASWQQPVLFQGLGAHEHLLLGALAGGAATTGAAIARVTALLPELEGRSRALPASLDRRAQRLLDIGRALAAAPRLLLLDEPAQDLGEARVVELVTALRDQGIAVLLAERYPAHALRIADRACLMVEGRIRLAGLPAILRDDERVAACCMGESFSSLPRGPQMPAAEDETRQAGP